MKELYNIMESLLDIEYKQDSLIVLLGMLDPSCDSEELKELKMLLVNMRVLTQSIKDDMKISIEMLDNYIVNNKN